MNRWYRVFSSIDAAIEPDAFIGGLRTLSYPTRGHFHADDEGWFQAELHREDADAVYTVQRYLETEDGFRDLLNTWAAGVEMLDTPHQAALMRHLIGTRQIFTVEAAALDDPFCTAACRWLAEQTEGVYQIDGRGYFDATGELLAEERE